MLAQDAYELIERCYEHTCCLVEKEEFKEVFIEYVFTNYHDEVVADYGHDLFYEHLDHLKLSHCRIDFDQVVEEWYGSQYALQATEQNYHEYLFNLVKELVSSEQPKSREELIKIVTNSLTSPNGLMKKWREEYNKTVSMYFKYLDKLGVRSNQDIESLIDSWLIEFPNAFEPYQQEHFLKQNRRGRPNNIELWFLIEKVQEMKPELTTLEKERLRKIYYYHRKTLTTFDMLEKFMNYISTRSQKNGTEHQGKNKNSTQVG